MYGADSSIAGAIYQLGLDALLVSRSTSGNDVNIDIFEQAEDLLSQRTFPEDLPPRFLTFTHNDLGNSVLLGGLRDRFDNIVVAHLDKLAAKFLTEPFAGSDMQALGFSQKSIGFVNI